MEFAITVAGQLEAGLAGELLVLNQGPPFEAGGLDQAKATVTAMGAEGGWAVVAPGASPFNHHNSSDRRHDPEETTWPSAEEYVR